MIELVSLITTVILILILLLVLYLQGFFHAKQTYKLLGLPASAPHFPLTLASLSDSQTTTGTATFFLDNIDLIQESRLEAIRAAKQSIQFETFIMTPGDRAEAFAQVLCEKSQEGVTVQLLADAHGADSLPSSYWKNLRSKGVEVRFFNAFSWRNPLSYLRRNHRKLLIVDQQVASIGGAGISDWWDGHEQKYDKPWLDFETQWRGEVVNWLTGIFWQHWLDAGGTVDLTEHCPPDKRFEPDADVLITPGEDPSLRSSSIRSLFQVAVLSAQKRIWIASPYLLPDKATCQMLVKSSQQGVDIRIVTMSRCTDKPYVYFTSQERYGHLIKYGIKIYEYMPSMMHAKILLIDDCWVSLGSANLDPRSFYHNDELNLFTNDRSTIQGVESFFERAFTRSYAVNLKQWLHRPLGERIIGKLSNLLYWQF
ncbi:phosphatidylserine/phosphatidylglycerophosphate/cardiolipin synthase family protein [Leptolyngbya sp. FACHB-16]|uniref:phospholipase D-like domain-containing protein n=1 Tax=unclassified Leptolyngbya TaxID=2650499 RepID=UPI001685B24A|nr:phosphatidylserine/phosphatidylglycerophosphate/cardiolipin synthase family protein [Leptolyngbya sp. FACHB-16]MBD2153687.1 phosphatidylserine/phosphatidylglycerophosphate/cardiolipin synthase family protein [Leptolyngbya sp. FACHB-16]